MSFAPSFLRKRSPITRDLVWETLAPGPSPRLDAGALQINKHLYCIGGYSDQDHVLSVVDVFDMEHCRWTQQIPMPADMPQSHIALACEDGRYIYSAAGQLGPRCRGAVNSAFVFDTLNQSWDSLPPLPAARYAPTMQLWRGRLHVMGGAKTDRTSPAVDHWSLGVSGGRPLEPEWRPERPIPRGGGHRASAVVQDRLYLLGGQEGDFEPISEDSNCACSGETVEYIFADCYRLDSLDEDWVSLPSMPVPASHTEFSLVVHGPFVIVSGGSEYKHPETFEIRLTDAIQLLDTRTNRWSIFGRLPFRIKTVLTALYDGWLYGTTGQRGFSSNDPHPGPIENGVWRARVQI